MFFTDISALELILQLGYGEEVSGKEVYALNGNFSRKYGACTMDARKPLEIFEGRAPVFFKRIRGAETAMLVV